MSVTNPCTYGTCDHPDHRDARRQAMGRMQQRINRTRLIAACESVRRYVVPVKHQSPLDSKMGGRS